MFSTRTIPAAAAAIMMLAGAAQAGHGGPHHHGKHHKHEAHAAVADALMTLGFTKWDEIEFDDGHWEVDDAVHESGRVYDLKLDHATLEVIDRELEK